MLASCYRAATTGRQLLGQDPGQPVLRLVGPPPTTATTKAKLVAEVRGVNVQARRVVDGRDLRQLERLCRYLARSPLAHGRLGELPDGRLSLSLQGVFRVRRNRPSLSSENRSWARGGRARYRHRRSSWGRSQP